MKLRSVYIKPAENGFTVEKNYDPSETERYEEPEMTVHESVESVMKSVEHCLTKGQTKAGSKQKKAIIKEAMV